MKDMTMRTTGHPFNPRNSRRAFLRGLGIAAGVSPFIPLLNASAQESVFPKRLVLFYTPHGTILDAWKPTGTQTAFNFGPILAPLEKHKPKVVVLNGLSIPDKGVGAPHTKGPSLLWSGSTLLDDGTFIRSDGSGGPTYGWNSAPSIDQTIANTIGTKTAYKSLEFGLRCGGSMPQSRMVYTGPKQPLPPRDDPYAAFGQLFANLPNAGGQPMIDKLTAQRKSSIDIVKAELDSLKPRASAADREKLDAHLTSLRSIETRLTAQVGAACTAPMLGAKLDSKAIANTPTIFDRGLDVMVASLACDLTRVASFQYRVGDNDSTVYSWMNLPEHHITTHSGDSDAAAKDSMIKIYTFFSEHFAYLLDRLDSIPEGNGTMLDNTLVVWGSELGKGNSHSFQNIPFVLAGGLAGTVKTGRFLTYPNTTMHNRLLVSICNLMGLPNIQTVGNTDTGTGPLPDLV
jgi:Protein of unknown function (DUF1552)